MTVVYRPHGCRYLVTLGTTMAPLEQYVSRDLLRSAIMSLVQVGMGCCATSMNRVLMYRQTYTLSRVTGQDVVSQHQKRLGKMQGKLMPHEPGAGGGGWVQVLLLVWQRIEPVHVPVHVCLSAPVNL
jgi:hypothetical protein